MPEKRRFPQRAQFAFVASAALLGEAALTYSALARTVASWVAPLAHVGIIMVLAVWCLRAADRHRDQRLPLLLTVSVAALGPAGAAGALAVALLEAWFRRSAIPFEQWYQSLFPEAGPDPAGDWARHLRAAEPEGSGSLSAFTDVLAFGSIPQKQALIGLIAEQFRPVFGPILKRALTDPNNAVRVQAATAMNKIEHAIHQRTVELRLRVDRNPGDIDGLRRLARHYDDYLFSGFLEGKREEEVRRRALAAYRECVARDPDDAGSSVSAGRLLLRAGQYEEAAEHLSRTAGGDSKAALWYMESLFRLGRFGDLRRLAQSPGEDRVGPGELAFEASEAFRLWGKQEPAGAGSTQ